VKRGEKKNPPQPSFVKGGGLKKKKAPGSNEFRGFFFAEG
jgi:hypothetical protein